MVASFGDRPVAEVGERIDSIQLAWLVHQVEQRYGVEIELDDAQFGRMNTVTGAVEVLRETVLVVEDA
jgi:acyl carrier protein